MVFLLMEFEKIETPILRGFFANKNGLRTYKNMTPSNPKKGLLEEA